MQKNHMDYVGFFELLKKGAFDYISTTDPNNGKPLQIKWDEEKRKFVCQYLDGRELFSTRSPQRAAKEYEYLQSFRKPPQP